jgi:hypothetical protein
MPQFHCPHCGEHIDAGDEYAGMAATCPSCNIEIIVPHGVGEVEYQTPGEEMQAEYPAEAEPDIAPAYAPEQEQEPMPAQPPPFVPRAPQPMPYYAPPGHPTSGFASDYARPKPPGAGPAQILLAVMATIFVGGVCFTLASFFAASEFGEKADQAMHGTIVTSFTIGMMVVVLGISWVLAALTALIFKLCKKSFWRHFLTSYGIYAILVSAGYAALFWFSRDAIKVPFAQKPAAVTTQPKPEEK